MKTKVLIFVLTLILFLPVSNQILLAADQSDDSCKSGLDFSFNADLVSRYIWRGIPQSLNPNIQPYASINYKNLSFGAWASYGLSEHYAEFDLYLSYTAGLFTFTVNDYFNENEEDLSVSDYFHYADKDSSNTPHIIEGVITFNGTENLPLSLTAATILYGNDKDTINGDNFYSTYLELAYSFNLSDNKLSVFAGGTVAEGYYAGKAAIVNLGIKAMREIQVSEKFKIPLTMSLIVNPCAQNIFFVFGMTF